jgi:hypothetical protein
MNPPVPEAVGQESRFDDKSHTVRTTVEPVVRVVTRPQDTLCGILKGDAPFTDMVATAMGLEDSLTAGFISTKRAVSTKHYGWGYAYA